jgi:hypothetical protein
LGINFDGFISNSPQKGHPERSALQIYRVTQRLMARSRGNPEGAYLTHVARSFSTTEARTRRFGVDGEMRIAVGTHIAMRP